MQIKIWEDEIIEIITEVVNKKFNTSFKVEDANVKCDYNQQLECIIYTVHKE